VHAVQCYLASGAVVVAAAAARGGGRQLYVRCAQLLHVWCCGFCSAAGFSAVLRCCSACSAVLLDRGSVVLWGFLQCCGAAALGSAVLWCCGVSAVLWSVCSAAVLRCCSACSAVLLDRGAVVLWGSLQCCGAVGLWVLQCSAVGFCVGSVFEVLSCWHIWHVVPQLFAGRVC
jgi:hypothetical protein